MHNSSFFLVLRRMRAPIIGLIVIYAISLFGLTLVPGIDAAGNPAPPMSFFHAFYFISYTATTIGFGEIPNAFSDAQRMWVTVCIYLTVVGWSYSVITLIGLLQDKGFQKTLVTNRFASRVKRLREPFYLICGCGETGSLIAKTFDHMGHAFVVLEKNELRVQELDLHDFKTDTPALTADASQPENLLLAGLTHPKCAGVLAMTDDEQANLAIAMSVRLLNTHIPIVACARHPNTQANMASFGTHHIINPFDRFAEHLAMAVSAPAHFRLIELLTSLPESPVPEPHYPPKGQWIMCGYGRFGHAVASRLRQTGVELVIIDPSAPDADTRIVGDGTEAKTLSQAGIEQATGIIAGTDNDINNLSIAVTALAIKPNLFTVLRQNHASNRALFGAYHADFNMVPSQIVAQESIAVLTTPLLARFLDRLKGTEEAWCERLTERLLTLTDGVTPVVWRVQLNAVGALAAWQHLMHQGSFCLGDILRDGTRREEALRILPLQLVRDDKATLLPDLETPLQPGDRLLFASDLATRRNLEFTLQNANEFDYVLNGVEGGESWLWRWWGKRKATREQ